MLKKIVIGVGVAVGLLVIGAIALIAFVDVNAYKPQIEAYVKDNYQRTLKIEGDLALSVFPRIALAAPKTTLSSRAGDRVAASLDGARASVALLPLLRGEIVVDTVRIDGLKATIERRRDGSTSIDDLIRPAADKPAEPAQRGAPPRFEIGGVELADAELTFNDQQAGNTITLTKLELKTGRIAPQSRTPVTFSTNFSSTRPAALGETRLKGDLDIDLVNNAFGANDLEAFIKGTIDQRVVDVAAKLGQAKVDAASGAVSVTRLDAKAKGTFGTVALDDARVLAPALAFDPLRKVLSVGGLEVSAKGKLGADAFEAKLAAPRVEADESKASGDRVQANLKLVGAAATSPNVEARVVLEGISGNAKQLAIGRLAVDGSLQQGARRVVAAIASPAAASFDAQTLALAKLAGNVDVEDPAIPQKTVKLPITGAFSIDAKKEVVDARFTTRFDETTLATEFGVRGFASPRITFDAGADKLDIDRYFPPAKPGPGNDSADPREDPKVDLSALKDLNIAGEARVAQLKARGVKAGNVQLVVRIANGRLDMAPLTAALYGGRLRATANATADNRIGVDANLTGVAIGPLLRDALDRDILEGTGNVKLAATTAGATVGGLKRGLAGSGSVALRDGAIKGVNIAAKLREARSFLAARKEDSARAASTEKTDFSELAATFTIKDGVVTSNDLDGKSPLLRLTGAGKVDLGAGTLDYTAKVAVVGTLKGQDGRELTELRGVTIPVRLYGPFEKLSYAIDWGSVAQEALKAKAAEQLKQKVAPQLQEQRDRLKDQLKGLLRR
ncbi:MAG: AsmA family protein [Pseudomonadota bacterium]